MSYIEDDLDGDGVIDGFLDNCDLRPNPNQSDIDRDGEGDRCDSDDDDDGHDDAVDNCVFTWNPSQADTDQDGIGNACDNNDGTGDTYPVRADAGGPYVVSQLDLDRFAVVSRSRGPTISTFEWDFGDDGAFDVASHHAIVYGHGLAGFRPQLTAAAHVPGSHSLRLRVGGDGRFSEDTTTLTVAIAGDLNADRVVDRADVAVMASHYGTPASETSGATGTMGDLTEDDRISLVDLVRMRNLMGSRLFIVPSDPAPSSVGANESLVVNDGGVVDSGFRADPGSNVYITGGTVGPNFNAAGGCVVTGGGEFFCGEVVVNLFGGTIGDSFTASGSVVNVFGGAIGPQFRAFSGSVHIRGSEFTLDGQPIAGLEQIGDSIVLAERSSAELAMVLADGTPWQLPLDPSFAADVTLRLTRVASMTGAASVPEPSSFALAVAGCLGILLFVRRYSCRGGARGTIC